MQHFPQNETVYPHCFLACKIHLLSCWRDERLQIPVHMREAEILLTSLFLEKSWDILSYMITHTHTHSSPRLQ